MKKLLFLISVCFLFIGCSNDNVNSSNHLSNSDPVTWLTMMETNTFIQLLMTVWMRPHWLIRET